MLHQLVSFIQGSRQATLFTKAKIFKWYKTIAMEIIHALERDVCKQSSQKLNRNGFASYQ